MKTQQQPQPFPSQPTPENLSKLIENNLLLSYPRTVEGTPVLQRARSSSFLVEPNINNTPKQTIHLKTEKTQSQTIETVTTKVAETSRDS